MTRTRRLNIGFFLTFFAVALASMILFGVRKASVDARFAALSDAARAACSAPADPDQGPRLYLIGDSSLSRWPAGAFAPGWETINCSLGRETAAQLARRFTNFDFLRPRDAALISSGLYDLVAASFFEDARAGEAVGQTTGILLDLARAASARDARVLLATLIPPSERDTTRRAIWRDSLRDLIADANARLRGMTLGGRIELVDFAAALNTDDRTTANNYRIDALHVNAIGNKKLATVVEHALSTP